MNICLHCGHHFEEIKVKSYDSQTGWAEEVCPNCGSEDFEEAGHCLKCGEYFPLDSMVGAICKDCVEKSMTVANAYRYGERETPEGAINAFVLHSWSPRQASDELLKSCTPEDARKFCRGDLYDFSEWLEAQDD